ncbi:EamA family transporter [Sphingobacterium hungaricum]|uniref:Permease n=1 Tax=Sphingobacterium hungaricum TaxID=2082723 RepID=A0A928UW71_9SPHI|nr:EamA family transporter [Sphingobacterium hungaricum]MBE8713073.1 permease [Sphingobacterium hungaricum]
MEKDIQHTKSRRNYFLAAFLAPFIWGFMSIPVRILNGYPAEDILYYRILSAVVLLWLFILIFRKKKLIADYHHFNELTKSEKKKISWLTLLASILIFANWYTFIYSINNVSIQSAALAYMICPLITTFAAYFILKEGLSPLKKFALFLAFFSCCLLATGSFLDIAWAITIASSYAFYLIIQRVLQGFDKLTILAVQLLICSAFVVPLLLISNHSLPTDPVFWETVVIIAVFFTIIPLYFSMYALIKISSSTTGVLLYINPILAFLLAIFYFKESIEPYKYIAYGILLIAIMLFNWKILKNVVFGKK